MPGFKFRSASLQGPCSFHLIRLTLSVKADAAEIKVTRWQASGLCSSCSTGMPSVMTQSSLGLCTRRPSPSPPGWPGTPGGLPQRGWAGVSPHPAPASVGVGSKERVEIGVPPLPLPPPGFRESPLAQPGPQLPHL